MASCLDNLAVLMQDTNRCDEAEPMFRKALEIAEAAFGRHHPNVAIRLNNLAVLLQYTNRCDEAMQMTRRALDILDPSSANTAREHPRLELVKTNCQAILRAKADDPD